MSEQQVRKMQDATPAGQMLLRMGRSYYDTESSARSVAEFAVEEIAALQAALAQAQMQSVDEVTLNETIKDAQKSKAAITAAVDCALRYGMIPEAHHKQWVIDQMLRKLLGKDYQSTMNAHNLDHPEHDPFDEGIAP